MKKMWKDELYESQSIPAMILWVGKCQETGSIISEQRRRFLLGLELWRAILERKGLQGACAGGGVEK